MSRKHKVTCDKCGKEKDMRLDIIGDPRLPTGWSNLEEIDFCNQCVKKILKETK